MFTGIITHQGTITRSEGTADKRVTIHCGFDENLVMGESIACCGACMTVVEIHEDGFGVDVSAESIRCTVPGMWEEGKAINLERSLRVGDRLGGHFVTGHVDGVAIIEKIEKTGDSHKLSLRVPQHLARFIVQKGSVTLDGVSLTVNAVKDERFAVNIIPHTWRNTTLGQRKIGDGVNFEADMIARYVSNAI